MRRILAKPHITVYSYCVTTTEIQKVKVARICTSYRDISRVCLPEVCLIFQI